MSKFIVNVVQQRASSYEIGVKLGKVIKDSPLLGTFASVTKSAINLLEMEAVFKSFSPQVIDELKGIADGLEIPYEQAAALFSGYDVPTLPEMGCSAFVNSLYYMRNYDFSPELYDGIFSLIQPDQGYASCGYNLQLIGRHEGVNEHGLAIGLHFVNNKETQQGIAAWTSVRMVLEQCRSTDEAITLLKEIPHATCYNFSVGDQNGHTAAVEASPSLVMAREGVPILSCVNHFQQEEMSSKNRQATQGSTKRNGYIHSLGNNQSFKELFHAFSDEDSPLFYTDYEQLFGTMHTFGYSFRDQQIITALARGKATPFSFREWVDGHDLDATFFEGMIK